MEAILRRTTPLTQRAEPSPLWGGTFPKRRTGGGTTRISRLRCGQGKRGCASRVSPSPGVTARRTRGMLVVRATPPFLPLVRHGGGHGWKPGWKPGRHPLPPLRGGRSHHNDPWREGNRADEEAGAATSTTGGVPCGRKRRLRQQQPESGAGRKGCRRDGARPASTTIRSTLSYNRATLVFGR